MKKVTTDDIVIAVQKDVKTKFAEVSSRVDDLESYMDKELLRAFWKTRRSRFFLKLIGVKTPREERAALHRKLIKERRSVKDEFESSY